MAENCVENCVDKDIELGNILGAHWPVLRAPASPGGHNNEDEDSLPACVCVGTDACTGGSSPNGIDADCVHLCKHPRNSEHDGLNLTVPIPRGELGGILGEHREVVRSCCGEVVSRRDNP